MPRISETESKSSAPTFKQFVRSINTDGKPRGLKVAANADGGYTFTFGSKKAQTAVIASKDEVAALGLASLGVKLS